MYFVLYMALSRKDVDDFWNLLGKQTKMPIYLFLLYCLRYLHTYTLCGPGGESTSWKRRADNGKR